jgi:hypothetical protein
VSHAGHERGKAPALLRLGRGERQRAHSASVERAEERDDVLPLGVIAGKLQRALDGFGAGVAVVNAVRSGHGSDLRKALAELHHVLVVEIGARHVDQFAGLLLNSSDHIGMAVAGGGHGDSGGEIEEFVAVNIGDNDAAAALGDQRVGAGVGRRDQFVVGIENALGIGAGQGGADLWSGDGAGFAGQCASSHGILRNAVASG